MKRWSVWAERKWELYKWEPLYPSVMFWLLTGGGLLLCVKLVKIAVEYYAFLSRPILWKAAPILLTLPSSWIAYYWLHRRFKRLSEEVPSSSQRLVKEAQRLMIAFTLVVYILFGSGLRIIDYLLEQLYH